IEQNVREAATTLINAIPESRRLQVQQDINGSLSPVLYVPQNRSAYLFKSMPKYVPYWDSFGVISQCAIVIPDDATGSVAHEVGHYFHHVLLGNSGYLNFFRNVRPNGHHVGMAGALNELIEEPAYLAEYYLKGSVGGLGPEKGTFLTNGGGGSISPMTVDYRDLEGMTMVLFASILREDTEIRNYANELVTVPVVEGSREQLWRDCYEIVASGTSGVLTARDKIETLLQNSGQAAKLPAMLQAIGWSHHVVCRFVDGDGNPLSGVTARAVSKVGTSEYRLPARSRESDDTGTYGLSEFFPGASILRVYYDGDSSDVPRTIPWTTPTNQQVDLGDIGVVSNELLNKLHQTTRIDFGLNAPHTFSDGQNWDGHFEILVWPLVWTGTSFTARHEVDDVSGHYLMTANGNVSADGRILNVEYSADFSQDQTGGIHTETHRRVNVAGLPYTEDYIGGGNRVVKYVKTGEEAEQYVVAMESTFTQTDAGGSVIDFYEYVSTNWAAATTDLDLTFRQ
ncbi:MAG: hypothetical protein KJ927_19935, partial [Candidatus Eisenbacteria bacterium]|nr:hypothetical protein [Candidatus Eisenbacteria bacterium]